MVPRWVSCGVKSTSVIMSLPHSRYFSFQLFCFQELHNRWRLSLPSVIIDVGQVSPLVLTVAGHDTWDYRWSCFRQPAHGLWSWAGTNWEGDCLGPRGRVCREIFGVLSGGSAGLSRSSCSITILYVHVQWLICGTVVNAHMQFSTCYAMLHCVSKK